MMKVGGLLVVGASAASIDADANPMGKVLDLMTELTGKIKAEGEAEATSYKEYFEWCDDVNKNTQFEIKSASGQKDKLEAKISELTGEIQASGSRIETLAAEISANTGDLEAATGVREKESEDYQAASAELEEGIDTLARAITLLEKEAAKNPAALAQVEASKGLAGVLQSLGAVVDAASFSIVDKQRLTAMVQSQQNQEDDDAELGGPASANYKSQSGGIIDVLSDMKEKAEGELSELRKAESKSKGNFAMLKQSLEDEIANDDKDLDATKTEKAANEESKASADGDLSGTKADLNSAEDSLATANSNCMQVAADHQATVVARAEELKVIAKATQILKDTASGAVDQSYSFLETSAQVNLAKMEVVTLVKQLARKQHSAALSQLASRIAAVAKYGAGDGADPFVKIKGMITDMISKLQKEGSEEADEKAFCDSEMAKTTSKKDDLDATVGKLTSKIDQASSRSTELKDEVKEAQAQLAALAKEQGEMDKLRREENADYSKAKVDLELGLTGVRKALEVLRNYYGAGSASFVQGPPPAMPKKHAKSGGGASSIINLLEVCESDFAANLAKEETQESDAAAAYEKTSQANKIDKSMSEQDVKYKTAEFKGLDKTISELSSDRDTSNTELAAVLDYNGQLKARCIAKPESYEEGKRRREAEITGLKDALSVLENEVAFVQHSKHHKRQGFLAAPSM